MFSKKFEFYLEALNKKQPIVVSLFLIIWTICTFSYWKKYDWNPTSMVNFGKEFALLNETSTPKKAILFLGEEGDLGAGYDGQIFYYFSRPLSSLNVDWPKGFDESYRAPRIGYPALIALFGFFGNHYAVFGMYFWNIVLILISYFALRWVISENSKKYSIFYLLSPFALGSYYVLVSDSVMVSILVIAYVLYKKQKYLYFILLSSLAILTKEPALFLLFPLGLKSFQDRNWKGSFAIGLTLVLPLCWHLYLSYKFPNWRATRLTEFILPFEGLISYSESVWKQIAEPNSLKELARLFSRFPLVVLFFMGVFLTFTGKIKKGWEFRLSLLLVMFMIGTGGYYHFWSVYENVSRMFTLSIPILILLKNDDDQVQITEYFALVCVVLVLFIIKAVFISKPMLYQIGF